MINIVCVKWGIKYSYVNVNQLYKNIKDTLSIPFNFYCYTEDPVGIDSDINIIPIETEYYGVWNKLALFNLDLDKTLYLDLDLHIQKDITPLLDKSIFTLVECYWKPKDELAGWDHNINSSVMLWHGDENKEIYDRFITNSEFYMKKYPGIDHFIYHEGFFYDKWEKGLIYSRMFGRYKEDWYNPSSTAYWIDDGLICLFNGPKELIEWDQPLIS